MRRPIIAIDVDDVLLESGPAVIADYNRRFGTRLPVGAYNSAHDRQAWGDVDITTAIQRVDDFVLTAAFIEREPLREVADALAKLAERYELHVLTGRNEIVAKLTNDWLERYFPGIFSSVSFSNLFVPERRRSKGEMCVELGASFLIDDHLLHVKNAAECGLGAVLFGDYPWNRADVLPLGVVRCIDWSAVLEYFDGIN